MAKKSPSKKAQSNEPSPTNSLSPNRQQRTPTSSYILSDSDDLTGSYTSYSSGEYSSVGDVSNQATSSDNTTVGKKKMLLKPAHHLNDDTDSKFGHGILNQVYKMQSLLEEYQNSLTALEIEKADNQQEINKLEKRLKAKSENEERYKEDIWNLELNNQELSQKINELTQELSRSNFEQTRHAREETVLGQELDHLKAIQQSWEQKLKDAQENHEQDIILLKKSLHANRIEKESLSKQIQELVAQHAAATAITTLRHVDNETSISNADDAFTSALPSQHQNALLSSNTNNKNTSHVEIDALKTSLNQAHEIIHTMQEKIDRERGERVEIDKLLREAQETIENYTSHTDSTQWYPPHSSPIISNQNHHFLLSPPSIHSHHHKQLEACSSKTCIKSLATHGKSLSDELSLAGSAGNFNNLQPTVVDEIILPSSVIISDQQGAKAESQKIQLSPIELTYVDLPSLSNLDMHSSFSSSNKSEKDNDYNKEIKLVVQNKNNQHYGSLLTKPESYFYKSRRDLQDEKHITPSALFASTAVESILNSKLELFPEVKKRNSNDDGSVTALTRTMIGDWMWKYTRKVVGSGISENRHRRFFWIHPYTQTLYWSSQEPGSSFGHSSTKSALVESFVLLDNSNKSEKEKPPSILIQTPSRGLKIECVDMPSHHAWLKSLQFILADNKDGDNMQHLPVPKLSRLSSVSKRHYLNRKKSRTQSKNNTAVSFPSPSTMFNNSTLVDLSNSNSNFLLKQV